MATMGGEGKLLGWQIYDRFKLYLFDERRNNGFLFFFFSSSAEILLITSATKSILDKRMIGNVNRWNAWNHR